MRKSIAIVIAVMFIGIIAGSLYKSDWSNLDAMDTKEELLDSVSDVLDSEEVLSRNLQFLFSCFKEICTVKF